jgi:hypothetical protein
MLGLASSFVGGFVTLLALISGLIDVGAIRVEPGVAPSRQLAGTSAGAKMLRSARHRVNMQQEFFKVGLGGHKAETSAAGHGNLQPSACHEINTNEEAHQIRLMAWKYDDAFFALLKSFAEPAFIKSVLGADCPDPACIHPKRAPLKAIPRMIWKLDGKYNTLHKNGCQDVTDIVRGSLIFAKAGDVCKFVTALGEGKFPSPLPPGIVKIEVSNVKHRMKASKAPADQAADLANQDVGYKDMLVNVKMYKDLEGKDFHIAELQVHLAGMIEAKSNKAKGGHLMYRVIRQQQEVIDGKGTTSRFGAQHKHFDTDADWSELTPIEEIPGKADKAAIQAFLPDAEVDKIVAEFGGIPRAQAQVVLARRNSRKVYGEAWAAACNNPEDPGGCECLQSLNTSTPAFHVRGPHVKSDKLFCVGASYSGMDAADVKGTGGAAAAAQEGGVPECCTGERRKQCYYNKVTHKCYSNSRHEAYDHVEVINEETGKLKSEKYVKKETECEGY